MLRKQEILYRYWYYDDKRIYKELEGKIAVTPDDLKFIDIEANKDDFAQTTVYRLAEIKHSILTAGNHKRYYENRRDYLIYLHTDYINRINATGDYDAAGIIDASEEWVRSTVEIMKAVLQTLKEQPLTPKKGKPYVIDPVKAFGDLYDYLDRELWKHHEQFVKRFVEFAVIDDDTPRAYPKKAKNYPRVLHRADTTPAPPVPQNEFHKLVRKKEKLAQFMSYLHEHIDSLTGVEAFIYIQAAIDAKILDRPPYKVAEAEFPNIGKRANYDAYVGLNQKFHKRKDSLQTIREEILAL